MTVAPGTRLGPYEIISRIGAGGMGEVYRARDTRLERTVAIKVLPSELAGSAQLRARFDREAKVISSLAHPNICTLHDVGSHDGIDYLVMEHLDGQTLADRLERGALPIDDALRCASEIADALEKAHRLGIVHRDLKPSNVMLTKSGAKLLDFGLAHSEPPPVLGEGATEHKPITEEGTILGTFQYMSPEQLEGRAADARSDIFAFGAVLYEMLTGKRAFDGKSRASLIAAILAAEPQPVSRVQPLTPPALERVVQICLRKDPDERWQSAHDLKLELEGLTATARDARPTPKRHAVTGWIAAAVVAAAAIAWFVIDRRNHQPARNITFELMPPSDLRFDVIDGPAALSPDGTRFVARVAEPGRDRMWMRSLDSVEMKPLPGTEGAFDQFWSADGRRLAFFNEGKLRTFDLATSAITTICDASDSRGGSWSRDDIILFNPSFLGPIHRVSASGGKTEPVTKLDSSRKETAHWRPSFLPDGKRFLFMALSENSDQSGVYLGSLDSPEVRRVLNIATPATYVAPGSLMYVNNGDLYSQPFDESKGITTGEGVLVARQVAYDEQYATAGFSASRNGVLLYHRRGPAPVTALSRMSVDGKSETPIGIDGVNIDLSRDGTRLAMQRIPGQQRNSDVWVYDLRRKTSSRLTFDTTDEIGPVWSGDGKRIVYIVNSAKGVSVRSRPPGGGGTEEVIMNAGDQAVEIIDWTRDGRTMIGELSSVVTRFDIVTVDMTTRKIAPLINTPFAEHSARLSPDQKWLAYASDESGQDEIYVQPYPPDGNKFQISSGFGRAPRWTGDSKRLFFIGKDSTLMSVTISTANGFEASVPRPHRRVNTNDYVVLLDGSEVIASRRESSAAEPIVVLTEWRR